MNVSLEHDEPDARRRQLPALIVEVHGGVPKRGSYEETIEKMQHQLRRGRGELRRVVLGEEVVELGGLAGWGLGWLGTGEGRGVGGEGRGVYSKAATARQGAQGWR